MKITVMRSNAGYYIGIERDGEPYARLSGYYSTDIAANNAMSEGWQGRRSENIRLEEKLVKEGRLVHYWGGYRVPLQDNEG